jgi:hypothetical protein
VNITLGRAWDSAGVKKNKFLGKYISVSSVFTKNTVETLGPHGRVRELYTSRSHRFAVPLRIDEPLMCTAHALVRAGPGSQRRFWKQTCFFTNWIGTR